MYKDSQEGKYLVKKNAEFFKPVAHDMKLQESKENLIFRKERHNKCSLFEGGNLVKHSKYELLNSQKKLHDTSDYLIELKSLC